MGVVRIVVNALSMVVMKAVNDTGTVDLFGV